MVRRQAVRVKLIEDPPHQFVLGDDMPRMRASASERQRLPRDDGNALGGALVRRDVMLVPDGVETRHQLA